MQGELTGEVVTTQAEGQSKPERLPSRLADFIASDIAEVSEKTTDPMARIIDQVLNAETADAVLTPFEVQQAKDIVGVPIVIQAFELNESEYDAGSPFYASMACQFPPDGDLQVVNCGHKKVIAQLVRLKQLDAFPVPVKFITRGKSKQGTPMLELTKWDDGDGPAPF